ncbi:MAG: hypothetical protein ACI4VQ_00380 [Clostridia bacterium]
MEYKYTLLISQYYHSRYSFIIEFPENFFDIMKKFIEEIEDYKRDNKGRPYAYGDIGYLKSQNHIGYRYNINDEGDIYIINSNSINDLKDITNEYFLKSYRESKQYIKKQIINDINNHHDYETIENIVKKYFILL